MNRRIRKTRKLCRRHARRSCLSRRRKEARRLHKRIRACTNDDCRARFNRRLVHVRRWCSKRHVRRQNRCRFVRHRRIRRLRRRLDSCADDACRNRIRSRLQGARRMCHRRHAQMPCDALWRHVARRFARCLSQPACPANDAACAARLPACMEKVSERSVLATGRQCAIPGDVCLQIQNVVAAGGAAAQYAPQVFPNSTCAPGGVQAVSAAQRGSSASLMSASFTLLALAVAVIVMLF